MDGRIYAEFVVKLKSKLQNFHVLIIFHVFVVLFMFDIKIFEVRLWMLSKIPSTVFSIKYLLSTETTSTITVKIFLLAFFDYVSHLWLAVLRL